MREGGGDEVNRRSYVTVEAGDMMAGGGRCCSRWGDGDGALSCDGERVPQARGLGISTQFVIRARRMAPVVAVLILQARACVPPRKLQAASRAAAFRVPLQAAKRAPGPYTKP